MGGPLPVRGKRRLVRPTAPRSIDSSGARAGSEPHASFDLGVDGAFGPVEVEAGAPLETLLFQQLALLAELFETVAQLTDGLDLIAAYTWLPEFTIEQSSDPTEVGKREPAVPEHWGSLWAHYTFQRGALEGFGFGGGVRYIGKTFGDSINSARMVVPSITLFDAAIDYESENWRFAWRVASMTAANFLSISSSSCSAVPSGLAMPR